MIMKSNYLGGMQCVFWICMDTMPKLQQRTKTKVYEDTVLLNFPLFCPKCKKETRVNVVKLKMTISNEPDA